MRNQGTGNTCGNAPGRKVDMEQNRPIPVTEPFLPPLEEYVEYLKGIWDRNWLTNQGPLVKELERKLAGYHGLEEPVACVANGGLALQILLRAMDVRGEVITTPFSYVATASCPLWEGCTVKFADIDPVHLTLDPEAAEAAITSDTEAILATHVYGNPCDVEAFERIGKKHGIAILYDAAHAFGVKYKAKSVLKWGDGSIVSMHATKLFHSVEGGFIASRDVHIREKVSWMHRFGHQGPEKFHGVGINAKMSELHAAMGLANFPYLSKLISTRRRICAVYDQCFRGQSGVHSAFRVREETEWNASYYPILLKSASLRSDVEALLQKQQIFPRRYFHPPLHAVESLVGSMVELPVAQDVSERILCLPLSNALEENQTKMIADAIKRVMR